MSQTIRYVSFDCYGTLTDFRVGPLTHRLVADRLTPSQVPRFLSDFTSFRLDEVLGAWKPYADVIHDALERTCKATSIEFRPEDATAIYDAIPTWGPHADVTGGLKRLAEHYPLVILSNASNDQIDANVELLGARFHSVFTAEDAGAYKPRRQAFEYMFDQLVCGPEHVAHVSSSLRYDLMTAHDMGIATRVFVDRGHDLANAGFGHATVGDIDDLATLLGCDP